MRRGTLVFGLIALLALVTGCPPGATGPGTPPAPPAASSRSDPGRVEAAGLHNVYRLTPGLYSGSSPDDESGFRSLRDLGIKTVLSVDGARPDVELAHKYGMRYVHLPIGYDGVPHDQALRIARAVRDLPGPIYVHCHHGQHRGPAAAAVAHLCLDDKCVVETVVAEMRRAGTDPHYKGLYAAPAEFRRPTAEELARVPADFPEVTPVAALAEVMVGVDERWDRLKLAKAVGWKVPPDHPDVDPPHEALQLREQFREAARLPQVKERPEEFRHRLADAETMAEQLEQALRVGKGQATADAAAAEKAFQAIGAACKNCHARYRDERPAPQGRPTQPQP
jgi:protein tyrosine phosphatase (PTP) superfamily phosphohydrolase (DUF442 family)